MPDRELFRVRARCRPGRVRNLAIVALAALAAAALAPAAGAEARLAVGLVAAALPLADGSGELALPVVIEVAAADERTPLANGHIQLSLRDARGEERAALGQPFVLPPEAAASRGIRLYAEFRVAAGSYTLEATARDDDSGAAGSASAEIRLPPGGGDAWLASPALVLDRRAGWRAARADQVAGGGFPFAFVSAGGSAYLPAASLEVGAGERIVAQAFVATRSREFPFVAAEAIPVRGEAARPLPANLTSVAPSAFPGVLAVTLELGPFAEPGEYRVRLGLASAGGRLEAPIGATLAVRALAAPAGEPRGAAATAAFAEVPADSDLANGYRRVLAALAAGGVDVAAPALVRFELAARPAGAGRAGADLRNAERAVLGSLQRRAGRDADPVRLAAAALAHAAAALYRDRNELPMAAESSLRAVELASEVARGTTPALRGIAVDLLALASPARALDVDSDHPLALLRTAISQERARRFTDASQTLARLLRAQPEHAEARLRSAIVLRRSGEPAAARDELARLVATPASPWILELAYSELGAIERQLGRTAEGVRWLQQGIERVEAQSLHLQLAFYLDTANRTSAATAAVNRLPVARVDGAPSARQLYSIEPVEESAAARARVAAAVAEALPALGSALAGDAGRGGGR